MAKYLKKYNLKPGFKRICKPGNGGLELTELGIINLRKGGKYSAESGDKEAVLVVLGGKCAVSGDGFSFPEVGGRKDVFDGKPHTMVIPHSRKYKITATEDVEIAWIAAPSDLEMEPYVITPDKVREAHIGRENFQRDAYLMLTDEYKSKHLYIGEAIVPSGNHASYPPHRHEFDNLPVEVKMEEVYFFRFNPENGYGMQRIYNDDRSINETYTIEQNDTTLMPNGYHPVVCAPGYRMYYLWIMAGRNNRKFLSVPEPQHKWIIDAGKK